MQWTLDHKQLSYSKELDEQLTDNTKEQFVVLNVYVIEHIDLRDSWVGYGYECWIHTCSVELIWKSAGTFAASNAIETVSFLEQTIINYTSILFDWFITIIAQIRGKRCATSQSKERAWIIASYLLLASETVRVRSAFQCTWSIQSLPSRKRCALKNDVNAKACSIFVTIFFKPKIILWISTTYSFIWCQASIVKCTQTSTKVPDIPTNATIPEHRDSLCQQSNCIHECIYVHP